MQRPSLSVGMPNFNHARFLPAALDALLAQSYQPLEIIVLDDGSTDDSLAILRDYARRHVHLRLVIHERNRGVNAALSELLRLAAGDYFFAPAADDLALPGLLEESMALLTRYPQAGLCSAQIHVIDEQGTWMKTHAESPLPGVPGGYYISPSQTAKIIRRRSFWVHGNTAIFRREAFLAVGGYRGELGYHQDGFMHLVLALKHGACFIPEPLAAERRMPQTISASAARNPAEMRRVRDVALGLMRGEFAQVFPRSLVRRWQARWDYWRFMAQADAQFRLWGNGLQAVLEPGGGANGFLLSFGLRTLALAWALNRLAAALLLVPFDLGTIFRSEIVPEIRRRYRSSFRRAG